MQAQDDADAPTGLYGRLRAEAIDWLKTLAWIIPAYLVFTTTAFANYSIPSESMVPTLEVGDRVVVSKFAYGYSRHSLPLNIGYITPPGARRFLERMPARGDVVVFIHPQENKVMIKRLIGMPGDVIEMRRGQLYINDARVQTDELGPLARRPHGGGVETAIAYMETLPNGVRHIIHDIPERPSYEEYGPFRVPEGEFFFMGDNRDNSADSRWVGMGSVPFENLIGRAERIYWAADFCNAESGLTCPRSRWFRPLHD